MTGPALEHLPNPDRPHEAELLQRHEIPNDPRLSAQSGVNQYAEAVCPLLRRFLFPF